MMHLQEVCVPDEFFFFFYIVFIGREGLDLE